MNKYLNSHMLPRRNLAPEPNLTLVPNSESICDTQQPIDKTNHSISVKSTKHTVYSTKHDPLSTTFIPLSTIH